MSDLVPASVNQSCCSCTLQEAKVRDGRGCVGLHCAGATFKTKKCDATRCALDLGRAGPLTLTEAEACSTLVRYTDQLAAGAARNARHQLA